MVTMQAMSNAQTTPPPLLRRSVVPGPKLIRFRIRHDDRPVGTILAATHADAIDRFMTGRDPLPDCVTLRAYAIVGLDPEGAR